MEIKLDAEKRDRPEAITPDMVDAGIKQFLRDYPETGTGDELDRRMVRRIFAAMAGASVRIAGQFTSLDETA